MDAMPVLILQALAHNPRGAGRGCALPWHQQTATDRLQTGPHRRVICMHCLDVLGIKKLNGSSSFSSSVPVNANGRGATQGDGSCLLWAPWKGLAAESGGEPSGCGSVADSPPPSSFVCRGSQPVHSLARIPHPALPEDLESCCQPGQTEESGGGSWQCPMP